MSIAINVVYIFPIVLALCLMLSMTHYAQNYAGIIGGAPVQLVVTVPLRTNGHSQFASLFKFTI